MKKIELKYSSYTLPLSKSIETAKGLIKERKGFIISLNSDSGKYGLGDAAPFPDFGSESFEDAEKIIESLNLKFRIDLERIEETLNENLAPLSKTPALRHGIEQALLNLICKEKGLSLNQIVNRKSTRQINVNAVLGFLSPEDSAAAASDAVNSGFSTLKLKAGRDSFSDDLECIKSIRSSVGNNINLRLDVNGKWSFDEAVKYLPQIEDMNIEYIEQPVSYIDDFVRLSYKSKIPLAADESIRSPEDAEEFITKQAAGVIIIKPMMLGGLFPSLRIIEKAEAAGIKTVVTSSFESVIGRSNAVFLASLIGGQTAHGIGTAKYFDKDLFPDPYPVEKGKISLISPVNK